MTDLDTFAEGYNKIHDYLLTNGQQELAGHLDGIWQYAGKLQQEANVQSQPKTLAAPTSQDFQDHYKGDNPKPVTKTEAEIDADDLQPDPASENS